MRTPIRITVGPYNIREFKTRAAGDRRARGHSAHGSPRRRGRGRKFREQVERGAGRDRRVLRQLKVARGRTEVPVPEQPLNRVQVDACFEQMGREGVAERVKATGLGEARPQLRCLIRALERGRIHRVRPPR